MGRGRRARSAAAFFFFWHYLREPRREMKREVDVRTETVIHAPPEVVFRYAADPDNAPQWYVNIESVEWETPRLLAVGSRIAFVAHFLGKRIAYTYEITELVPDRKLVMRTAAGPFPMETTYQFEREGDATRVTLRNRGSASGFSSLAAPMLARSMRKANEKDLAMLKSIVEGGRA